MGRSYGRRWSRSTFLSRWESKLPQAGVDRVERLRARDQVRPAKFVQRRGDRVQRVVQVAGLGIDIEQAGDDLALGLRPTPEMNR